MFKIESYITSIILANADRYIRNFKKQDVQVSLWEGDATFHNIDLNVEALNEEFQSPLVVISGYIHDLIIHVPWTKLLSEPVVITVNTIECVMRLKSKDERTSMVPHKKTSRHEDRVIEAPPSSYTSALTNKIMNNLSIRCENVILKVVEEDIVFSMNIEKLQFDNVNESWTPAMTDLNADKLQTRKLITLSGLTICLDKQNSSGRIETYMEPLLYRCLIHVRLLRSYHRAYSKCPVFSYFDILSDKMSFTFSEPQIPMLLKLIMIILGASDDQSNNPKDGNISTVDGSSTSASTDNIFEDELGAREETSWTNWLWSMVPAIMPQDDENLPNKPDLIPTHHVGLCIKQLDLDIKVWNNRPKTKAKQEFKTVIESKFLGCFFQITTKHNEWYNSQFGVNCVSIEIPTNGNENRINQVLFCGVKSIENFSEGTLFDPAFKFAYLRMHQKIDPDEPYGGDSWSTDADDFDFTYNIEFSMNTHLNFCTENILLDRNPAFAVDYVKSYGRSAMFLDISDMDGNLETNETNVHFSESGSEIEKPKCSVLLRLILGSSVTKITPDFLNRITFLHKIVSSSDIQSYRQTISDVTGQRFDQDRTYKTQFTLFDLKVEFHVPPSPTSFISGVSKKDCKFSDIPESFSSCHSTPILNFFCKCIDGEMNTAKNNQILAVKTAEFVWSLMQSNRVYDLVKCEKQEWRSCRNLNNQFLDVHVDFKRIVFKSSKPNMLLAYFIANYLMHTLWHSEERHDYYAKIFFSSLIDDTLLNDNVVLELSVESLSCVHQSFKETYAYGMLVNGCRAFANKFDCVSRRILIFTLSESETHTNPIKLQLQRSKKDNDECSYPTYFKFTVGNVKLSLDPAFHSWLSYETIPSVQHKPTSKVNKTVRDNLIPKSVPSRKVSDSSSGSHGRKYGSAHPKPRESVHSSGEPEVHSPTDITETDPSDTFQISDNAPLPKTKKSFIQYVAGEVHEWCTCVVHGNVSNITIYFPTIQSEPPTLESHCDIERTLINTLGKNSTHDSTAGVLIFFLESCRVKCDFPGNLLDELDSNVLLSVHKNVWSVGKSTSPWDVSVNNVYVSTLTEENVRRPLLEPFSANCSIGVSFRRNDANDHVAALCVHFDLQPLFINVTQRQTLLISKVVHFLSNTLKESRSKSSLAVIPEQLCPKSPSTNVPESDTVRKLTGWIQWTFTKCSIGIYHESGLELTKLSLETEDSIGSLEFDDVFHKFKIKLSSFGVFHRVKCPDSETWQSGPFCGALIQRCYSVPSSTVKTEEDADDRFLLATITRARSSHLSSRLTTSNFCSDIQISSSVDRYVTELILDICPVDVILPLCVLSKFLLVLKPLLKESNRTASVNPSSIDTRSESENVYSCLPITYFSLPVLRIFLPLSCGSTTRSYSNFNTLMCEIRGIAVDCHPKNPILRKQSHSKFFQSSTGKRFAVVEQKLQNQQYELSCESVSLKTGSWSEIEQIIFKEQSSVKQPPSVFEQNPAVMWNQGYHPGNNKTDHENHLSTIVPNFTCTVQLAPSIKCYSLRTTIQGPQLEVNVLTDLAVTISLPQICLLMALYDEYVLLTSTSALFVKRKEEDATSPAHLGVVSCRGTSMRTNDSGIESLEQNSVASSSISKSKSEVQTPNVHHLKPTNTSNSLSHVSNSYKFVISVPKKLFFEDIFVTAPKIDIILYRVTDTEGTENSTVSRGLLFCEFVQPSFWLTRENNYPGVQVEVFDMSVHIADPSTPNVSTVDIPNRANFPIKILEIRKLNHEPYSKLTNACFTLKMLQNMSKRWKVECILGQPMFLDCQLYVIRHVLSVTSSCFEDYHKYMEPLTVPSRSEPELFESKISGGFLDRLCVISTLDVQTSRFIFVFKAANNALLLNVDAIVMHVIPPNEIRTQNEAISVKCEINSIAASLPELASKCLSDILAKDEYFTAEAKKYDFQSNLVLKPCSLKVEVAYTSHRSNSMRKRPSKCLKIDSPNVSLNLSPACIEKVAQIMSPYVVEYNERRNRRDENNDCSEIVEDDNAEFYKDDLRAGAFQYIKIDEDKNDSPSPYEVYLCNRRVHPFMCWRYPQLRSLTKLQIYPILVDVSNDELMENGIRCQLQYYDEMTKTYTPYVMFNLLENSIQNIVLPSEKPGIIAAECWRIVLFDFVDSHDNYDIKMDIKSLVGCVRVDSIFQPSYVPEMRVLVNMSDLQFHFYVSCENENLLVDVYFMDYFPRKQCFLSVAYNDVVLSMSDFRSEKVTKFSGVGKANILNYEYLMLQSFVEPFSSEVLFYYTTDDSNCKLAAKTKTIHFRISPQFVHTLSGAQRLWQGWKSSSPLPTRITAPYIICNNTNQLITFRQESTSREVYLSPYWCHLFAWYSPTVPKLLRLSVFCGRKQYTSKPFGIGCACSEMIVCKNDEGESCMLSITVIQQSSVIHQVIIRGSLLAYNLTQSEIDMCIVSHGKKTKNKLSSAQVVSSSTLAKRRLLSAVLPLEHQLVFKIRFAMFEHENNGPAQWSGLISLKTSPKGSNQTSWLVKIPLKNHKEHFRSVWCQVTFEIDREFPVYLIVFRPLCSVVSFSPWNCYFKIYNDLDNVVDTAVSSKGQATDLHIPDAVSLDKYTVEFKNDENSDQCFAQTRLESTPRKQTNETKLYSVSALLADIEADLNEDNQWPYMNVGGKQLQWKTDQTSEKEIQPIIKVLREERIGCGTRIELYPWAIISNLLDYKIILATSNAVYTISPYEVYAPPYIEGTFKIGLIDNQTNSMSGTLQLADDQSFPIPKVSGRIPMNGFVTTMIDCDNYVTFVNMTSKSGKEMRIIGVCSTYVINNNSSVKIGYSAWVVCRSGTKSSTSFDMPLSLESKSVYLAPKGDSSAGQAVTKWHKIGSGDVQVLPYLILTIDDNIACPVRICDLSEKQRYPVVCSNNKSDGERLPCVFMTAQQCDGQVFLTLWDETVPQITIHNMSQLPLNIIASRSENGNGAISYSVDWNWKFRVLPKCLAHFHTQNQTLEKTKKQFNEFLMFSVESKKHIKQTKWSSGVPLTPCVNQLITLPLSQHHIKLAIFRNGFTFVVWIESATADELSAKMIRARLTESFLPINEGAIISLGNENSDTNVEDDLEVPDQLKRMYNANLLKPISTNIFIEEICVTLAGDDELTLDENDIVTFCAKNVFLHFTSACKPNEVAHDILVHLRIDEYQLDNDEYCLRAYDFPVVLLSQRANAINDERLLLHHVDDLLLNSPDDSPAAMKTNVYLNLDRNFSCGIREVELNLGPLNVYLEDKYLSKLKSTVEKLISAVTNTSLMSRHRPEGGTIVPLDLTASCEHVKAEPPPIVVTTSTENIPEKAISSTSKSVNVSEECDVEERSAPTIVDTSQSHVQSVTDTSPEQTLRRDADSVRTDERVTITSSEHLAENCYYVLIPDSVVVRSKLIARPIRLRSIHFSPIQLTVSVHTSTTFYIALDRSPLKFSEFKKQYLIMTPFELGNVLVLHYFFGAIYGTGWAISSLEFVGSPGVLARNLGTGVMDFISMPIYGISSGPRGLVLGIAHGSASLMKHIMAGTLSSVTNFAGSWARTLNRFTLDADDLLQSEQIRRFPPNNVTEGVLQGLAEFGISLLGGISGIAHHPLQYAASSTGTGNRSLFNSISLGLVGVLTRPLSGAAELVARTGQGIMSHVGWNSIPAVRNGNGLTYGNNNAGLQICNLKYEWKREYENVILTAEGVKAENIAASVWIILTSTNLYVIETSDDQKIWLFNLQTHEFYDSDDDPTLICVQKPLISYKTAEDFSQARIYKFVNETNQCFNIKSPYATENTLHLKKIVNSFAFCVNPQMKSFLFNMIAFVKNMNFSKSDR